MKYFLGMGAGYRGDVWRRTAVHGSWRDYRALERLLAQRYGGNAILCKNGRTALCVALQAYFKPGDAIIVNGFTCYAVVEAVRAAGLTPVYADISPEDLNFTVETLEKAIQRSGQGSCPNASVLGRSGPLGQVLGPSTEAFRPPLPVRGIIIQNSLGNPVDIEAVEKFAREHELTIIEDLAHCTGVRYADGREAGTVGAVAVLSFGKEKMIDATSGGAVIFADSRAASLAPVATGLARSSSRCRAPDSLEFDKNSPQENSPHLRPRLSDYLRERFYPLLSAMCRGLTGVRLGGVMMRLLVKIHWVERSADNRLDPTRRMPKFEAKLALEQMRGLRRAGAKPVREFFLLNNRDEVLAELKKAGYYFDGFWYERPVSPARYYEKAEFPEAECPVATEVAKKIINFPTYYRKSELKKAYQIVEKVGVPWAPTEAKRARSEVPVTGVDNDKTEEGEK